ncbi:MAG: hypothetical protein QF609_02430 [Gammaproteobacteria bacterium]|jgi:hypothetical protein|nr:hypothetical protein [Gammaproteobacteria bacterium]
MSLEEIVNVFWTTLSNGDIDPSLQTNVPVHVYQNMPGGVGRKRTSEGARIKFWAFAVFVRCSEAAKKRVSGC